MVPTYFSRIIALLKNEYLITCFVMNLHACNDDGEDEEMEEEEVQKVQEEKVKEEKEEVKEKEVVVNGLGTSSVCFFSARAFRSSSLSRIIIVKFT